MRRFPLLFPAASFPRNIACTKFHAIDRAAAAAWKSRSGAAHPARFSGQRLPALRRLTGSRMPTCHHRFRPAAYPGSCTGGRLSDLQAAAEILRGRRVAAGCRLLVSPASQTIWRQAAASGLLSVLADAGATILAPSCGACLGVHSGLLAAGESGISTTNRNFRGRMGSPESKVYLASPATVAAAAVAGKIVDCREFCRESGGGR